MTDERTHEYGNPIGDPRFYEAGPMFIRQPNQTVFNVGRRKVINDVSLLCIATGWPTPSYRSVYYFLITWHSFSGLHQGSISLAFWMCSYDVRFTVECVLNVIFELSTLKITSKTHSTVKSTSKLHIQNAGVIDP
jgi:hypothetical protein